MVHSSVPHRRRSTKQLISQYESLSPAPSSRQKDKSPIRHSLRNLLSVFKRTSAKSKQDEAPALSGFRRQLSPTLNTLSSTSAPPVLESPSHKLSSSLLYLSHTSQPSVEIPILPVWTSCTATLESDSIVIACLTAHGNPSVHVIHLTHCTDVRSLSLQQLPPEEASLLPKVEEHSEFKIFEILFEGRPREKFAANSAQGRAGWVSAIWDTILPSQEEDTRGNHGTKTFKFEQPPLPPSLVNVTSTQSHTVSASRISSYSSRSLPPVPNIKLKPIALNLDTHVMDTLNRANSGSPSSMYPPTRAASLISPGVEARSISPSINKLSQLSVVQQRLVQMESTSSHSSYEPLTSPTSSKASHSTSLTSPALSWGEGPPTHLTSKQDMLRVESGRSSAADSILDSYGEAHMHTSMDLAVWNRTASNEPSDQCLGGFKRPMKPELCQRLGTIKELPHDPVTGSASFITTSGDQLLTPHSDLNELPCKVTSAIDKNFYTKALRAVDKLEEQTRFSEKTLAPTHKIEASNHNIRTSGGNVDLLQEMLSLRGHISQGFSRIQEALISTRQSTVVPHTLDNVATSQNDSVANLNADISELHRKLDHLLVASKSTRSAPGGLNSHPVEGVRIEETLARIMNLLENDNCQHLLQAQQQAESTRCLTELNSWLEAFVNNGTAHLQDVSANVTQLCQDLRATERDSSVTTDIRQLALSTSTRDHYSATLQTSIDRLLAVLREQSAVSSGSSIASLIGQQRQEYEELLRALMTEISNEIRGERLRFVEAMKEATAINVQVHVEQFKKELKREVIGMTQEVGRLHQDRQAVQNQIAELFAFYTKQKAAEETVPPFDTAHANLGQTGPRGYRPPLQPGY